VRAFAPKALRAPPPDLLPGLAALALAATAATVVLCARSHVLAAPAVDAVARGLIVATWAAAGLHTWQLRPASRLGPLMLAVAILYAATSLNALRSPAAYTLGSLVWPFVAVLIVHIAFVFPSGRAEGPARRRMSRALLAAASVVVAVMLRGDHAVVLVAAPLKCAGACPHNPFAVGHLSDDGLQRGLGVVLATGAVAALVCLIGLARGTSATERRVLTPAAVAMGTLAASFAVTAAARVALGADHEFTSAAAWAVTLASLGFPVALYVGQARGRLIAASSLRRMVARLSEEPAARGLEGAMAEALGDPSLRLAFWLPRQGFVDQQGLPLEIADNATFVHDRGGLVAAIVHDPVLEEPVPGVVGAAARAVMLALENARLEAEVRSSERRVRESRARLQAEGMRERRRLERNLHDTAQQRLVALRIKLGLAEERVDTEGLKGVLRELGGDVETSIDGLREVARGLYPPLLADRGLAPALRGESLHLPGHLRVAVGALDRSEPEVEAGAYVCCHEVLSLLADEPGESTFAVGLLPAAREVRIDVHGDAAGDVDDRVLLHIRDRVGALGGWVRVSRDDDAWTIAAGLPWPAPRAAL